MHRIKNRLARGERDEITAMAQGLGISPKELRRRFETIGAFVYGVVKKGYTVHVRRPNGTSYELVPDQDMRREAS